MNPESNDTSKIKDLLEQGIKEEVYPGAVLLVSKNGKTIFLEPVGYLSVQPKRIPVKKDTIFDLASLTKPLATTLAIMHLVDKGIISLDKPISDSIGSANLGDKRNLTVRLLLNHSAGLRDWKPFYLDIERGERKERKEHLRMLVIEEPFAYKPGSDSLYSDLGFILLEWVIEEASKMPLPDFTARHFYERLSLERTFFNIGNESNLNLREDIAATEACPWRKEMLKGIVHDENAFAAGGFAGHAGLFSTASEVFLIANMLMEHYKGKRSDFFKAGTVKKFFRRQDIVPGSSWALGWDTPSEKNSSSGSHFSSNSVGHLGFAGTSIWMDLERDVIVVFLTNRVNPTRNNNKIRAFRPLLHDLIMESIF